MDHAIQSLKSHYNIALERLYEEWKSGEYRRIGRCPHFDDCLKYREALNVLQHISNVDILGGLLEDLEAFVWIRYNMKFEL